MLHIQQTTYKKTWNIEFTYHTPGKVVRLF